MTRIATAARNTTALTHSLIRSPNRRDAKSMRMRSMKNRTNV